MTNKFYLSLLSMLLLAAGCSKKNDKQVAPEKQVANITLISPTRGQAGTAVTIDGQGFTGNPADVVTVLFNGVRAQVVSLSATQVTVYAPAGATSGVVQVVNSSGDTLTGGVFNYGAPLLISSVTPAFGPPGTVVRVRGTGFGNNISQLRVYFNGIWATLPGAVTDTAVLAIVPAYIKSDNMRLVVGTDSVSGPLFTPTAITGLTPAMGLDGSLDTITGTGFSPVLSENKVTYRNIPATVISGNTGQLVVKVPQGISGNSIVAVTINGNSTMPLASDLQKSICVFKDTTLMITFAGYVRAVSFVDTVPITSGPVGAYVQLHGYGFNTLANHTQVTFNGMPATVVTGGRDTMLYAKIPPGATSGPIVVTSNGQTVTGPSFTVTATGVATFAGNYNTVAGGINTPRTPFTDGPCVPLGSPSALAFDNQQNMYVLDFGGKVNTLYQLATDGNSATTLVKDTKKIPVAIHAIVFDKTGNMYLASNNNIFTVSGGAFQSLAGSSTYRRGFADGKGANALFATIVSLAIDPQGNMLVVDKDSSCIRKIASDGTVTTPFPASAFHNYLPGGALAVDQQGNIYYASGTSDNAIVKMSPDGQKQETVAWWPAVGSSTVGAVGFPGEIVFDNNGDIIFTSNYNIFRVVNGSPVKIAGSAKYGLGFTDGALNAALFNSSGGTNDMVIDAAGNIFKAEPSSAAIRKIILH